MKGIAVQFAQAMTLVILSLNPGGTNLLILIVSCLDQQKKKKNTVTLITIRIKVDFLQDKEALHQ